MPTITWKHEDADGAEVITQFPARWEICGKCRGDGTQDCFPGGITSSEWHYEWDQDEKEAYLNGHYDMPCSGCEGTGKVAIIDEDLCTGELADLLREYREYQEEMYQLECMYAAERRMGA